MEEWEDKAARWNRLFLLESYIMFVKRLKVAVILIRNLKKACGKASYPIYEAWSQVASSSVYYDYCSWVGRGDFRENRTRIWGKRDIWYYASWWLDDIVQVLLSPYYYLLWPRSNTQILRQNLGTFLKFLLWFLSPTIKENFLAFSQKDFSWQR